MSTRHDLIVIGLGPAGMAVSAMGAGMGLDVLAIESHKIGGECMNVGCIPSKALLRMAKTRAMFRKLDVFALKPFQPPEVTEPFVRIQQSLNHISQNKTRATLDKVNIVLGQGKARFVDPHTVEVAGQRYTARRIFIAVGTRPMIPEIPGLDPQRVLTNENMFHLDRVPETLTVLGSGAIAVEMAQAFSRLGSKVTMVFRGPGLLWREDADASKLLEKTFESEGITLLRDRKITKVEHHEQGTRLFTQEDGPIEGRHLLLALGRRMDLKDLNLEAAGVKYSDKGIEVDRFLRTSAKHIFAPGDCNGYAQFSHAAMHQGMIALMNCMIPWPFKRDYRRFVVPWTVFTEPQISWVGPSERELRERGTKYQSVVVRYDDYGAAIAENVDIGFVKVLVSPTGRILAAGVVGEGSGESINEWGLAVQKRLRMHDIMLLQHSFPSMAFLNKRASETWMMEMMKSQRLRSIAQRMYRWF